MCGNGRQPTPCCVTAPKLIFPCSGAADVGEITDQAARKLTREGIGRMYCLAGIGGRVENIMESTKAASKILVIDGCQSDCARNTLLQAGFKEFEHLRLTDMGMEKGKSPVSEEKLEIVLKEGGKILGY
jgi:uncharacterized metal-binding protein